MAHAVSIGRLSNALAFSIPQHKVVFDSSVLDFTADTQYYISVICHPLYKPNVLGHQLVCKSALTNVQQGLFTYLRRVGTQFQISGYVTNGGAGGQRDGGVTTTSVFEYNRTYHVVIAIGGMVGSEWKAYVDGVLQPANQGSNLQPGDFVKTTEKMCIGAYNEATNTFNDLQLYHYGWIKSVYIAMGLPTQAQVNLLYKSENTRSLDTPYLYCNFREKNGKVLKNRASAAQGTLLNYTDAETASNGQPQSGNTAWVNAYSHLPVTQ